MKTERRARRRRPAWGLALFLLPIAATAEDLPDLPEAPGLPDFVRIAELRNPGLEASRRQWRAESEAADAAGSFPDPTVSVAWFAREVETRVGPQQQRVSLRQPLPWFGRLGLKESEARRGVDAAESRYREHRSELRSDVTLAWLDLYWIGRAISLTAENLDLLVHLEEVIRERYRTAQASHADLIRVQVELGVLENRLRTLEDRARPLQARMNALLHRPEDAPVPVPTSLPDGSAAPAREVLFDAIRRGSPVLHERAHQVAQADAAKRLADRSRWPDWMLGADWIRTGDALNPDLPGSGKDPVIVSLSVNVPLFRGKWDAPARAAEERLAAAHARARRQEDELLARAESVLFDWRDADRRVDLYHGVLLPKARQSYEALDTAYRTGRGGFLDLIEAQRTVLEFELERERALTDRSRSTARLEHLMGDPQGEEASP